MEDNYKPSKEFTDQAWSNMKALLDKEMPDKGAVLLVPSGEKRKGFLLLLPLLLLVVIAALFFYYQSNRDFSNVEINDAHTTNELAILPQIESSELEKSSILEKEKPTRIGESVQTSKTVDNSPRTSNLGSINDSSPTNNSSIYKSNITPQLSNAKANQQIILTENQNTVITEKNPQIQDAQNEKGRNTLKPFATDKFENVFKVLDAEKTEEDLKEEKVSEPIALLEELKGQSISLLSMIDENPALDKFSDIQKMKTRRPLYGFVGLRNYEFSNNLDFVSHVETVLRKANKNLGFRTGFNYAQRSTTYLTKVEAIARVNSPDFSMSMIPQGSNNESAVLSEQFYADRAVLNANPIKYHFLEIPFLLDYKFSKKWSMHTGLSAKALLYSSEQDFGLLNGFSLRKQYNVALQDPIENFADEDANTSYFTPQKFNIGVSLGFNYMATSRLGVQARYSRNLRDIYPELNGNQYSNSLEFGLAWRFR